MPEKKNRAIRRGFIYIVKAVGLPFVKIGYAANPEARLDMMRSHCPLPLAAIAIRPTFDMRATEEQLHLKHARYRVRAEWFIYESPIKAEVKTWRRLFPESQLANSHVLFEKRRMGQVEEARKSGYIENPFR